MMARLNIWNTVAALLGVVIVGKIISAMMPANVSIGGGILLFIGVAAACSVVLGGEILIKKQNLTGAAMKVARAVTILLGLFIAIFTVVNIWSWGAPNLGAAANIFQLVFTSWTSAVIWAAIILIGCTALFGLYHDIQAGGGRATVLTWRTLAVLVVVVAFLIWLLGEALLVQTGGAVQQAARSQLSAVLAGQPTSFHINWNYVALGFLGLAFVWGLKTVKIIQKTTGIAATIVILPFIIWLAWGALPAEFKADMQTVTKAVSNVELPAILGPSEAEVNLTYAPFGQQFKTDLKYNQTLKVYRYQQGGCTDVTAAKSWRDAHHITAADSVLFTQDTQTNRNIIWVTVNEPYRTMMKNDGFTMTLLSSTIPSC